MLMLRHASAFHFAAITLSYAAMAMREGEAAAGTAIVTRRSRRTVSRYAERFFLICYCFSPL